jgi:hypothetical protein
VPDELLSDLSARSIVTQAEALTYLKMSAAKADEMAVLRTWIDHVSGWIEDITHRKIKAQAITEITSGCGGCCQRARYFPVIALQGDPEGADDAAKRDPHVSAIQYRNADGTGEWENLLTDLDPVYLSADPAEWYKIELLGGYVFPAGRLNLQLRYWAGWADPPQELKEVALEMLFVLYEESRQGNQLLMKTSKSAAVAGGSSSMTYTDLRPRWKDILSKYTIWSA